MTVDYYNSFTTTREVSYTSEIYIETVMSWLHKKFPMYEFYVWQDFINPTEYTILLSTGQGYTPDRVLYLKNCCCIDDIISGVCAYLDESKSFSSEPTNTTVSSVKTNVCTCPNCGANKDPYSTTCNWCGTVFY